MLRYVYHISSLNPPLGAPPLNINLLDLNTGYALQGQTSLNTLGPQYREGNTCPEFYLRIYGNIITKSPQVSRFIKPTYVGINYLRMNLFL